MTMMQNGNCNNRNSAASQALVSDYGDQASNSYKGGKTINSGS